MSSCQPADVLVPDAPAALGTTTPQRWADEVLRPRLLPPGDEPRPLLSPDDLDPTLLASVHARLVADGATAPAAAKWLSGWYPGSVAQAVGWVLATASAALLVEPAEVRWRLHPDGWPEGVDVGAARLAVTPDHPWAGLPGSRTVDGPDEVLELALASVVDVGGPLVARLRPLAKVGLPSLWAEVGDRLGTAVAHDLEVDVREAAAERLRAVVRLPAAPWRVVPLLAVEPTAAGAAYLGQKGGCCLAYQGSEPEQPAPEPGSWLAAYRERWPLVEGRPDVCSTCPLLDRDDCRARQRLWVEHHRSRTAPS